MCDTQKCAQGSLKSGLKPGIVVNCEPRAHSENVMKQLFFPISDFIHWLVHVLANQPSSARLTVGQKDL